mmetsp:Transcript_45274/g.139664  ORF Transcript_45274/g.139664 Transcript_45274/m.139664 type:complete len:314 (+) Transcript_45274:232-1173(+)
MRLSYADDGTAPRSGPVGEPLVDEYGGDACPALAPNDGLGDVGVRAAVAGVEGPDDEPLATAAAASGTVSDPERATGDVTPDGFPLAPTPPRFKTAATAGRRAGGDAVLRRAAAIVVGPAPAAASRFGPPHGAAGAAVPVTGSAICTFFGRFTAADTVAFGRFVDAAGRCCCGCWCCCSAVHASWSTGADAARSSAGGDGDRTGPSRARSGSSSGAMCWLSCNRPCAAAIGSKSPRGRAACGCGWAPGGGVTRRATTAGGARGVPYPAGIDGRGTCCCCGGTRTPVDVVDFRRGVCACTGAPPRTSSKRFRNR